MLLKVQYDMSILLYLLYSGILMYFVLSVTVTRLFSLICVFTEPEEFINKVFELFFPYIDSFLYKISVVLFATFNVICLRRSH